MKILHAGCGGERLPSWLPLDGDEVRLDVDERVSPDIVASIDDLGDIGPFGGVYCCHTLEHLHWHRAMLALREFHRVLAPDGIVFIQVPNLQGVKPDDTVHYVTATGHQITGLDMFYGYRPASLDNPWMMHKCGFIARTLREALEHSGFVASVMHSSESHGFIGFDLIGMGRKI